MSACPLCTRRKAKRPCPAKATSICSACCGSQRRVTIDCPDDCIYLTGEHAAGWDGRATERRRDERRVIWPAAEGTDSQMLAFERLLLCLREACPPYASDELVRDAVTALRKTLDSRIAGLIYEHPCASPAADRIVLASREFLDDLDEERREALSLPGPTDADRRVALLAVEKGLAACLREEPQGRVWLDSARRLLAEMHPIEPARTSGLIIEP